MTRTAVFIDHENIRIRLEKLKLDIYEDSFIDNLKKHLGIKGFTNLSIFAYDNYSDKYYGKKDILHQYKANGITPIHALNIKDSVDMELSLDAYEKCLKNEYDNFIIVSCDKDMFPLIRKLKDQCVNVYLVALTFNASNYVIRQTDEFYTIEEIMGLTYDTNYSIKSDIISAVKRVKDLFDWASTKGNNLGKDFTIIKIRELLYSTKDHSTVIIEKLINNGILSEYTYNINGKDYQGIKFIESEDSKKLMNGEIPNFY